MAKAVAIRREKKKFLNNKHAAQLRVGVLVDPKKDSPWYWRFVEFGTVNQSARPFLVPAFESMKYAADAAIKKKLLKGVERQAKRVRKK